MKIFCTISLTGHHNTSVYYRDVQLIAKAKESMAKEPRPLPPTACPVRKKPNLGPTNENRRMKID